MKTLCQQYIYNVKSFFPIIGKNEKIFIANLENIVNYYCEEKEISTMSELYKSFGEPNEIVNSYYSSKDLQHVLKNINTTRILKTGAVIS